MPRPSLTHAMIEAMFSRETGETIVLLMTLAHPAWIVTERRALHRTPFNSRGETYFPLHFAPSLPGQEEGRIPRWEINIDGVDQTILAALRAVSMPKPTCLIEVVMSSDPNTVQMTTGPGYSVFGYSWNVHTITLEIAMFDLQTEGYPGSMITPSSFPVGF